MPNPAGKPPAGNRTIFFGGLLALLLVGGVVAYALFQSTPAPLPQPMGETAAVPTLTPPPVARQVADAATPATVAHSSGTPAREETPAWETTIDSVLNSNVEEAQMAQILINLLPTLPEEGQIEAANHIANLLPDENYKSVRPLLLNPGLPESVQSVLFTDLMNRDEDTKLNAFLDIAQIPNHPFHEEALSDLQIYVGDDYGEDWGKWKTAVSQYLKAANTDSH